MGISLQGHRPEAGSCPPGGDPLFCGDCRRAAYVAGSEITAAVYVPLETQVDRGDVFVVAGADKSVISPGQYEVVQRDFKDNVHPSAWLLSLQKANVEYRSKDNV